jgi:hypothetical protein
MRSEISHQTASVKLYPRLAATKRHRVHPPHRVVARRVPIVAAGEDFESRRTDVRARLLRMILNNEEARRNEQRPSAS